MKRLENGILYVDIGDLVHLGLIAPIQETTAKIYCSACNNSLPFKGEKSKEFFMNCEDIYDYDYISSLKDEEITAMLIKIEEEIFYYEGQFFNLVNKDFITRDDERKKKLKTLYYQKETLTKFLEKRKENSKKL